MTSGYGVFLPPNASSDEDKIARLGQMTGLSQVDSKLILASHLPRRVFTVKTASEGKDRVRFLRAAGFDGFIVSFDALARVRVPQIHSAAFSPEGIDFQPVGSFHREELRLVIHGEFITGHDIERTITTYPRGITGFQHPRTENSHDRSNTSEQFLHLYGESHDKVFELRPHKFNFHCLGTDFALSAALNQQAFIQRLKTLWPDLRYDDTLLKHPPILEDQIVSDRVSGGNPLRIEVVERKQGNEEGAVRASFLLALSILRR